MQKITKEFDAGVTAISSHPSLDHMFSVGSYDEYVRLYDLRMLNKPIWKVHVGGGVWRIKWHPTSTIDETARNTKLLVASMHGGCRVIECIANGKNVSADIISSFTEHESMAYGADWIWFQSQGHTREAAASCSFYDRNAFIWSPAEDCQHRSD